MCKFFWARKTIHSINANLFFDHSFLRLVSNQQFDTKSLDIAIIKYLKIICRLIEFILILSLCRKI
jgi:hypothetical protein